MSEERRVCVTHRIDWPCPSCALHSAEREVLEACVEEDRVWVAYESGGNSIGKYDTAREARIAAVRRYRALLDGKEAK